MVLWDQTGQGSESDVVVIEKNRSGLSKAHLDLDEDPSFWTGINIVTKRLRGLTIQPIVYSAPIFLVQNPGLTIESGLRAHASFLIEHNGRKDAVVFPNILQSIMISLAVLQSPSCH
jgi:hypothetical protein